MSLHVDAENSLGDSVEEEVDDRDAESEEDSELLISAVSAYRHGIWSGHVTRRSCILGGCSSICLNDVGPGQGAAATDQQSQATHGGGEPDETVRGQEDIEIVFLHVELECM